VDHDTTSILPKNLRPTGLRIDLSGPVGDLPRFGDDDEALRDALSYLVTERITQQRIFWPKFPCLTSLVLSVGSRCVRTHAEAAAFYSRWLREVSLVEAEPWVLTLPSQSAQGILPGTDTVLIVQPIDSVDSLLVRCAAQAKQVAAGKERLFG
jgi:hypothetical protein